MAPEQHLVADGLARRPATLDGVVLGLLDNNKHGARVFLEAISRLLGERFQLRDVVWAQKPEPTRPAAPALLDELLPRVDVLVTAAGD